MSDAYQRPSQSVLNAGILLVIFGLLGSCGSCIPAPAHNQAAQTFCSGIGSLILLPAGVVCLVLYFSLFRLRTGFALVKNHNPGGVITHNQWLFGKPKDEDIIKIERKSLTIPDHELIELHTPDDGVLGIKVSVSFCPDISNGTSLLTYKQSVKVEEHIQNRVRSSLNSWVRQKPLPGTTKRALSMQKEAEHFIMSNIAGTVGDTLVVHKDAMAYRQDGFPVSDLGIRLLDVNIVDMKPLKSGTGKPDWGDDEHVMFNAQEIFKQFSAHADSLSNLRKLKEALLERYPDEADDIEDIYDQVRISMKETRDR